MDTCCALNIAASGTAGRLFRARSSCAFAAAAAIAFNVASRAAASALTGSGTSAGLRAVVLIAACLSAVASN